jgi:hypothetical protein
VYQEVAAESSFSIGGKLFADDEEEGRIVKIFYTAGFEVLVKKWDKCINIGGRYVEK